MMKNALIAMLLAIAVLPAPLLAAEGLISIESSHSVSDTTKRLLDVLEKKKMNVFAHIRHSETARSIGVELRDTELIIFGNPKVGSPLMKCSQTAAIDLPQKALIGQDAEGKVWVFYNDPRYLEKRHEIKGCDEVLSKVEKALSRMLGAAAGP